MYLTNWIPEWEGLTEEEIDSKIDYAKEFYNTMDENIFHIDNGGLRTVICICGSRDFDVGKNLYFTGLKCRKCKMEFCIHEG